MVNNSVAKRNFQTLLEFCDENNPREQSSDCNRNPDRGSGDEIPRGWEFVGYDSADGNYLDGNFDLVVID